MNSQASLLRVAPLALLPVLPGAGCKGTPDPGNTSRNGTRQVNSVEAGVVESVRVVTTGSRRRKTPDGLGLEVIVRKDSGQTVSIVREGAVDAFRAGDLVTATNDGSAIRVSRR